MAGESVTGSNGKGWILLFQAGNGFVLFLLACVVAVFNNKLRDNHFAFLLFAVPPIAQFACVWAVRHTSLLVLFVVVMSVPTWVYEGLWIAYLLLPTSAGDAEWAEWLSVGATVCAALTMGVVLGMTGISLGQRIPLCTEQACARVRHDVRAQRFTTIIFFVCVFLCVTNILTFALALHNHDGKGLEYPSNRASAFSNVEKSPVVRFFFRLKAEELAWTADGGVRGTTNSCDGSTPPDVEACNTRARTHLAGLIGQGGWRHVVIVGHADPELKKDMEAHNIVVSRRRAGAVENEIRELFFKHEAASEASDSSSSERSQGALTTAPQLHGVAFTTLGVGSAQAFVDGPSERTPEGFRHVEVVLVGPSARGDPLLGTLGPGRMTLLDYLYFMTYTITTTGYGDILPRSAYVKFVVTLANIFEVLFLVVFFNALIATERGSPGSDLPPRDRTNAAAASGADVVR